MNRIWYLFDEDYVLDFFRKKVLPYYPTFRTIERIKIIPHKRNVWEDTYHVVLEFKTYFRDHEDNVKSLSLFCSAHSSEPRKNVYSALKYLWRNGFGRSNLTVPRPLFYSDYFRGTFYRGVQGDNLYSYIKDNDHHKIRNTIPKTAQWFAKLHNLPLDKPGTYNFNKSNSRIRTAIPGKDKILRSIKNRYPEYHQFYKQAYAEFIKKEEDFLASTDKRYLIHGDAHPENVIKMSSTELAVIDYTDLCLSDFARDLGCFLQQWEFMCLRKMDTENSEEGGFIQEMKDLFLNEYLNVASVEMTPELEERITNYYYWTMIRSATYLLIKSKPQPQQGRYLVERVKKYFNN